jgi:hypothetical protein
VPLEFFPTLMASTGRGMLGIIGVGKGILYLRMWYAFGFEKDVRPDIVVLQRGFVLKTYSFGQSLDCWWGGIVEAKSV